MKRLLAIFLILISTASARTYEELKAETDDLYKDRTLQDWKDRSVYRGVTQRSQKDFDWLLSMYPKKLDRLAEMLAESKDKDEQEFLAIKIARIKDKFAVCCQEVKMRADGDVIRPVIHDAADYYIDWDNGDDDANGLSPATAWQKITKYTTVEIRTPGDRAFLRADITWDQGTDANDITFDENSDADNYISIIGCDSVTNDPWGDSNDVKPIIDFEDAAYQITLNGDNYWWLERLDIRQSLDTSGAMRISQSQYNYLKNCVIRDGGAFNVEGVTVDAYSSLTIDGCAFENTYSTALFVSDSIVCLKSTTFTAGADVGTPIGIYVTQNSTVYAEDVTFVATFGTSDVTMYRTGQFFGRNTNWSGKGNVITLLGRIFSEDDDSTFESHITTYVEGTITRGTASPRAGGADSYAIMAPTAKCGINRPLILGDRLSGAFKIWIDANAASTISVYARVPIAWAGALTAAQCYITASYLDSAGDAGRTILQSTETILNDTNWQAFTVTIPASYPKRDGWVYVWFYLAHWEDAADKVEVDIKPVIN